MRLTIGLVGGVVGLLALSPLRAAQRADNAPRHGLTAEQHAVLAPLETMADGFAMRDLGKVGRVFLPGAGITLLRDDKPLQFNPEAFVAWIAGRMKATGPSEIKETFHDPIVLVDRNVASIWAPYIFMRGGKLDHCGTDVAALVQQEGRWLIASLEDNSRKDCEKK